MRDELVAIHADARADLLDQPFYTPERFAERLQNYVGAPGFDLVAGRLGGLLVGYAFGSPLLVNTAWWNGLEDATDRRQPLWLIYEALEISALARVD